MALTGRGFRHFTLPPPCAAGKTLSMSAFESAQQQHRTGAQNGSLEGYLHNALEAALLPARLAGRAWGAAWGAAGAAVGASERAVSGLVGALSGLLWGAATGGTEVRLEIQGSWPRVEACQRLPQPSPPSPPACARPSTASAARLPLLPPLPQLFILSLQKLLQHTPGRVQGMLPPRLLGAPEGVSGAAAQRAAGGEEEAQVGQRC